MTDNERLQAVANLTAPKRTPRITFQLHWYINGIRTVPQEVKKLICEAYPNANYSDVSKIMQQIKVTFAMLYFDEI